MFLVEMSCTLQTVPKLNSGRIDGFYFRLNSRCHGWKHVNVVDSNGDRVNVGNFDGDGLNVNNWNDRNRNDRLGVSSSRQFVLAKRPLLGVLHIPGF